MHIRPLNQTDRKPWEALWRGYLEFYKSSVPTDVFDTTFSRLLEGVPYEPNALVAENSGELVGLVHYLEHRHCWKTQNVIYLQDLFASPNSRNQGVGRALIEAVYEIADQSNFDGVYWTTESTNSTAIHLYDTLATRTRFIKYQR